MMDCTEAKNFMLSQVSVDHTDVVDAKAYLAGLAGQFSVKQQARNRADDVIGPPDAMMPLWQDDPTPQLRKLAKHFSVQLATFKAAWELISSGVMLMVGQVEDWSPSMAWTTMRPGSGGYSSSEDLKELLASYPQYLLRPSWIKDRTILSDADLYLQTLDAVGLHEGIKDALRQAILCFRSGYYVPTVAMLDAASEGAWIEAGKGLATKMPTDKRCEKLLAALNDPRKSLRAKVSEVCDFFESRNDLQKASGITPAQVRDASLWAGIVRDARNVLHWNVETAIPNDYTKVATLVLAALGHMKRLHSLASV